MKPCIGFMYCVLTFTGELMMRSRAPGRRGLLNVEGNESKHAIEALLARRLTTAPGMRAHSGMERCRSAARGGRGLRNRSHLDNATWWACTKSTP
jgi:hypothetical protein